MDLWVGSEDLRSRSVASVLSRGMSFSVAVSSCGVTMRADDWVWFVCGIVFAGFVCVSWVYN